MSDEAKRTRTVGDLEVEVDLHLCVGFGDCVEVSPDSFALDAEGLAEFVAPEEEIRERLLEACRSCPVDAITVRDAEGRPLVP